LYLLGITLIDPVKYGLLFERFLLPERAGLYAACTTRIVGRIDSKDSYRIGLENSREILLDRDARLVVRRGDEQIEVYADELREGDDILFDNRDLLFEIDRQS
jgi:DNA polymerase-3 subunit alpha